MSEIKRCPFCGGEAKIDCYLYFDEFDDWFIRCTSCFCRTRTFKTKKSAILTWNNRKPMERIVERLEEENTLIKEQRKEAIEYDDEQMIFATNNQIRAFDYSLRVIKEEGGMND